MIGLSLLQRLDFKGFFRREDGVASIEILFMLPAFFILFMSAYEGGIYSTRHVMLERGVDMTVRDVRIGTLQKPSHTQLRQHICDYAAIIPNCMANLQLEMVIMDPRNWSTKLDGPTSCINRAETVIPTDNFTNGVNNELLVLRVCSLFDPVSSTSGWGKYTLAGALSEKGTKPYALVATSAFVMEPFQ